MLDSGAFSAFKRGVVIDRAEYASFLAAHKNLLDCYVNLDVIPGRPGKAPSIEEVETAAGASLRNYEFLRGRGLDPMPVFHCGESFQWLQRMLDAGADYIGLGGTVGKPRKVKVEFFKKCYAEIARVKRPIRTHGFGCTSASLVAAYPFTTVDSTSWVIGAANGYIMVPAGSRQRFDYGSLHQVRVTGLGSSNHQVGGFGPAYWAHVVGFLGELGVTLEGVRIDQAERNYVNMQCAHRMAAAAGARMYFSTWLRGPNQGQILTRGGMRHRLLSYWEVYDRVIYANEFVEYIKTGLPSRDQAEVPMKASFASSRYVVHRTTSLLSRLARVEDVQE